MMITSLYFAFWSLVVQTNNINLGSLSTYAAEAASHWKYGCFWGISTRWGLSLRTKACFLFFSVSTNIELQFVCMAEWWFLLDFQPKSKCLPDVYIFGLRCLYHGTDKHHPISRLQFLSLQRRRPWRRENRRVTSLSVPVETQPAGPPTPTPTPPQTLGFPWWEQWQSHVETSIHWRQLSRQDFPNILQQEVALFVSSMCSCFRSILPCCCPPPLHPFLCALIPLMLHRR